MHSPSNGIRFLGIVCLLLAVSVPAFSQTITGRILGTVTDQSGAAVAGATVIITDVQRGTSRTVVTDDSGNYVAPELQPGTYKVRAEAKGFKTVERPNIPVEVADGLARRHYASGRIALRDGGGHGRGSPASTRHRRHWAAR